MKSEFGRCSYRTRAIFLIASLFFTVHALGQSSVAPAMDGFLPGSLIGDWVGLLEYRDYSEPSSSSKRVDLPTWLTIERTGSSMTWKYTYDDGPNKVVRETATVTVDVGAKSYTEGSESKLPSVYSVDGYDTLKEGRGVLMLHGKGTDNQVPSETRTTMTISRNLLIILEEVRPAGSSEPFAFRHRFQLTRAKLL